MIVIIPPKNETNVRGFQTNQHSLLFQKIIKLKKKSDFVMLDFFSILGIFVVEILRGGGLVWGSGVLMYLFHAYRLIAILYCKHTHNAALKQELIKTDL